MHGGRGVFDEAGDGEAGATLRKWDSSGQGAHLKGFQQGRITLDFAFEKMRPVMRVGWELQLQDYYNMGETRGQERMMTTATTISNAY